MNGQRHATRHGIMIITNPTPATEVTRQAYDPHLQSSSHLDQSGEETEQLDDSGASPFPSQPIIRNYHPRLASLLQVQRCNGPGGGGGQCLLLQRSATLGLQTHSSGGRRLVCRPATASNTISSSPSPPLVVCLQVPPHLMRVPTDLGSGDTAMNTFAGLLNSTCQSPKHLCYRPCHCRTEGAASHNVPSDTG